jgi:hypothetical protein
MIDSIQRAISKYMNYFFLDEKENFIIVIITKGRPFVP